MTMLVVTGVLGIAGLIAFLGFMLVWVKALPLIIIVLIVVALLIHDFIQTIRFGNTPARR